MNNRALIAMSGGVDSSVAAYIMKEQKYDCIGITIKLFNSDDLCDKQEKSCCSLKDVEDARSVANKLQIPYYVFNFSDDFKNKVIARFVSAYQNGATPNPCIDCNRFIKFDRLLKRAKEIDCDYVVTGHYAQVNYDERMGRYLLKKAVDDTKDQSYVLYSLTQEQLARTLFPLGELRKTRVRKIAEENGFINAQKQDSQDICFVPNGDYSSFIREYTGEKSKPGNFVDIDGNILGEHKGIIHYTIGQRKGLGVSFSKPLYVCKTCPENNTVVLGDERELYARECYATDINLISVDRIESTIKAAAKVRYKQSEQPATVTQIDGNTLKVVFDEPQRAITKGQAVVLYDGDIVIGGGTII
jgi:tRNA-specific 2-thiouridylase